FFFFCFCFFFFFFFSSRRRHTRCLSDWSSDVCSSDLGPHASPFPIASEPLYRLAYLRRILHSGLCPETWPDTLPCRRLAGYLPVVRRLSCLKQFRCSPK